MFQALWNSYSKGEGVSFDPQQLLRRWLEQEFKARMKRNPNYSLRAFAKSLRISPSALSEILAGKRSISEKRGTELMTQIALPKDKISLLKDAFAKSSKMKQLKKYGTAYTEELLTPDYYTFMADWRYFAILSLLRTDEFPEDSACQSIAARLQIPPSSVRQLVAKLRTADLIIVDRRGMLRCVDKVFRSPAVYPKTLLHKRAKAGFKLANEAMKDPEKWHYVDFATITTDPRRLEEAQNMIDDFVKRLGVFLGSGEGSEVFELSVNLFSLSRSRNLKSE